MEFLILLTHTKRKKKIERMRQAGKEVRKKDRKKQTNINTMMKKKEEKKRKYKIKILTFHFPYCEKK